MASDLFALEGVHQPKPGVAMCDTKVLVKPKIFSVLEECFLILASESEKKAKKSENCTCLLKELTRIQLKFTRIQLKFTRIQIKFTRIQIKFTRIQIKFTRIQIKFTRIQIKFTRIQIKFTRIHISSQEFK